MALDLAWAGAEAWHGADVPVEQLDRDRAIEPLVDFIPRVTPRWLRPEHLALDPQASWRGRVSLVEPTGAETELLVKVGDFKLVVTLHGRTDAQPGETVWLQVDTTRTHLFDGQSEQRL